MITFTDESLYVKGTCNVVLSDITTGNICFQSSRATTGSINPGTTLEEVRGGLGNAVAATLASDAVVTVDFELADFSMWAKAAQMGAELEYGAPSPRCQVVTANDYTLSIDPSYGVPVPELGKTQALCYVQTVDAQSFILSDGVAYPISQEGTVGGFTSEPGKTYKVWYSTMNYSSQMMVIRSFVKPKVVRFEAQMAVYTNRTGSANQGTRVGWLNVVIPYLQLQGDAALNGDQSANDTTKISGSALSRSALKISSLSFDGEADALAYYVYTPDEASVTATAIVVMGGAMILEDEESAQIPVRIVMGDGSLVVPDDYETGFTYTLPPGADACLTVSNSGVVTAITGGIDGYQTELTVTYEGAHGEIFTCPVNISISPSQAPYSNLVGTGLVGYMIIA